MYPPRTTTPISHQRGQGPSQGFEGIGRGAEGELGRLGRRAHEVSAERIAGSEGDGVKNAVDAAQRGSERSEVVGRIDVEFQDGGRRGQPRRRPLRHPARPAEARKPSRPSWLSTRQRHSTSPFSSPIARTDTTSPSTWTVSPIRTGCLKT